LCEVNYFVFHTKCLEFVNRKAVCELAKSHNKRVKKEASCNEDI